MKRRVLCFALICILLALGGCSKPPSYPLDTDLDAFFQSHIDQYTAAAEILWEYGEPVLGEQEDGEYEWETSWLIHPAHPEWAIDSPFFLNYFTKEQWQIVRDAYHLTEPQEVAYYQSTFSYRVEGQPDPCIAPGVEFSFIVEDSNGKIASVSYVYIKPTPGGEMYQAAVVSQMIRERSQLMDEWERLDAEFWYRSLSWL